jgi:hypothetical protein
VYILVVIFTNIGGCLNLIVFISIHKKRRRVMALDTKVQSRPLHVRNPYQVGPQSHKVKTQNTNSTRTHTPTDRALHHSLPNTSVWYYMYPKPPRNFAWLWYCSMYSSPKDLGN